jgi:hypothetical protein
MDKDQIQEIINRKSAEKRWPESERKVIGRYGQIFNPLNLDKLTKEDFKSFLLLKNNLHWEGIHRQGNIVTADMDALIKFLKHLLDENIPIRERLNTEFIEDGGLWVKGMGRAVVTAILLVVYPEKYGVWNSKSEAALKKLKLYPKFSPGDNFGDRYLKVNEKLASLSKQYNISLWNVDNVLGILSGLDVGDDISREEDELSRDLKEHHKEDITSFGTEKYLEDHIIANWDKTIFGRDYDLLYEENDLKSQQYPTSVGEIDILARTKDGSGYVVIELKKGKTSDAVCSQVRRYMNWVKKNMAKDKNVHGVIIVHDLDDKIRYTLMDAKDITLYTYKMSFTLIMQNSFS